MDRSPPEPAAGPTGTRTPRPPAGVVAAGLATALGGGLLVAASFLPFARLGFMGLSQTRRVLDTPDGRAWLWMGVALVVGGAAGAAAGRPWARRAVGVLAAAAAALVLWSAVQNLRRTEAEALANVPPRDRGSVEVSVGAGQPLAVGGAAAATAGGLLLALWPRSQPPAQPAPGFPPAPPTGT